MADEDAVKRRYREFLDLMPVTLSIAGLAPSEPLRNFTPDQMELRAQVVANAFKFARETVRDAINS